MSWKDNPVSKYLLEARDELAKVVWPTRSQAINHTLLVIGLSLALAAYFGALDFLLSQGLEKLLSLAR